MAGDASPPTPPPDARTSRLTRLVEHVKSHPVVYAVGAVVAGFSFVFEAVDVATRVRDTATGLTNPHAETYAALAQMDLDSRLPYFEDTFGTAKSVYDLCEEMPCPEPAPDSLQMYVHEDEGLAVRAVFDGDQLEMYLVTVTDEELSPPMTWLGYELGELGRTTFADALTSAGEVRPTDTAIFMGPQATAYAEVVSVGAPGSYRGLVLAHAPKGFSGAGTSFDVDSARALALVPDTGEDADGATLRTFRRGTTANTYGEFRDDGGYVGSMVRDADMVIPLLFVGTEL